MLIGSVAIKKKFHKQDKERETNKVQLFYQLADDLLMITLKCHQCHNLETSDCYKIDERKITSFLKECPSNTLACAVKLKKAGIPEIFRECADNSWLCDALLNVFQIQGSMHSETAQNEYRYERTRDKDNVFNTRRIMKIDFNLHLQSVVIKIESSFTFNFIEFT
ncbi:hypothetical protein GQX74_009289 [Glossina fuscipes]|nr:hypothetical protein GQX74_009289 [Glossina fuscipes]